jgi:hypothetical protein
MKKIKVLAKNHGYFNSVLNEFGSSGVRKCKV